MDERGLLVHPEIVTYATQSAFFTAYDCLDIGKVKVEVATYERGQGQTGRAVAYLDAADLRLVIHALKTCLGYLCHPPPMRSWRAYRTR